jgi:hypothetical protein
VSEWFGLYVEVNSSYKLIRPVQHCDRFRSTIFTCPQTFFLPPYCQLPPLILSQRHSVHPENGVSKVLRNVSILPHHYTASQCTQFQLWTQNKEFVALFVIHVGHTRHFSYCCRTESWTYNFRGHLLIFAFLHRMRTKYSNRNKQPGT